MKTIKYLGVLGVAFLVMLAGLILHIIGQKYGLVVMTSGMMVVLIAGIISMISPPRESRGNLP